MMDFLIYEGKVAVALLVFYLFYRFLLKKETFHRFNRVVLVGTAVLSFLLPLFIITIHKPIEMAPAVPEQTVVTTELPVQDLHPLVVSSIPWWPIALAVLFWAGVAFVLARMVVSILSIVRIIRQGRLVREENGCKIVVTERDIDPFSWMHYIVLPRKDWDAPHATILEHEKAHIGFGHSIELLMVDVLSALQWFNPAIWMLRADLRELHEYEADDAVLRSGANLKEYQYLLIRKAVGKSGYSVANSFNHSILKNRITMMSKTKSPLSKGLRVLYLLPLVCLAIGLQAQTVYEPQDKERVVLVKIGEDGEITMDGRKIPRKEIAEYIHSLNTPTSSLVVKVEAEENTPKDASLDLYNGLREAGVVKIWASAKPMKDSDYPLVIKREAWGEEKEISMEEAMEIDVNRIRSQEMLEYADAREKYGEKAVNGVLVYNMKLPQELDEIVVVSYGDDEPIPFQLLVIPDTMPKFQGGDMQMFSRWLNERLLQPAGCKHTGEMRVLFTVGTDGSVHDVNVAQSVCEALDAMVISIIEQSPKWEPALKDGKPVAQIMRIPITFQMR